MSANRITTMLTHGTITLAAIVTMLAGAGTAQAAPPVKLVPSNDIANGFEYAISVAVNNDPHSPEYGDVYVSDRGHGRVQVLSPTGAFVEMFGREVNETTKENICTALSGNTCQAGVRGSAPGQLSAQTSIAIDPSDGNVFVAEQVEPYEEFGQRVQEFTAEGQFVLEIGKEVNATKDKEAGPSTAQKNLCSELEVEKGAECGPPAVPGGHEDGAFKFESGAGNLLAVGGTGSKDLLYVGEEGRVQEFEAASGSWVGEIPLTSIPAEPESKVQALAFDPEDGNVYLVYPRGNTVREFDPEEENAEGPSITLEPRYEGSADSPPGEVTIGDMALDSDGDLALAGREKSSAPGPEREFGLLYAASDARPIDEFTRPRYADGLAFSDERDLYIGAEDEVVAYAHEPIAELLVGSSTCLAGVDVDTSATFDCTLDGLVDPEGVAETETLFEYGRTPRLGAKTATQKVEASGQVEAVVSLRPNETYYYRLGGYDHNVEPTEEAFSSELASLLTPTVAPQLLGAPSAPTIRPSSAVLFGELNPENAQSEYFFEYAPAGDTLAACTRVSVRKQGSDCAGVSSTPIVASNAYGKIGTSAEVTGLQPDAGYDYRLFVENESRTKAGEYFHVTGPETSFTTLPAPAPSAQTGAYGAVTPTGAVITGTVNPGGQPSGYAFELGVYNGASTQYTVVASGAAGSSSEPAEEELALSGLRPGTTYAYRIAVTNGYIENEAHALQGAVATFTTTGIAAALTSPTSLALLPVPAIAFPVEAKAAKKTTPHAAKCKRGYTRDKQGKCVKRKKAKKGRKARKSRR